MTQNVTTTKEELVTLAQRPLNDGQAWRSLTDAVDQCGGGDLDFLSEVVAAIPLEDKEESLSEDDGEPPAAFAAVHYIGEKMAEIVTRIILDTKDASEEMSLLGLVVKYFGNQIVAGVLAKKLQAEIKSREEAGGEGSFTLALLHSFVGILLAGVEIYRECLESLPVRENE